MRARGARESTPPVSITGTSFETNYLNITYNDADLNTMLSIRDNPLLKFYQLLEEGGSTVEDRFMPAGQRGFSSNLVDAQTISGNHKNYLTAKFDVPFGKTEGSIRIPWADILRSRKSDSAGAKALDSNVQTGLDQHGAELVRLLVGSAGHSVGLAEWEITASGAYPAFALRFAEPSNARNLQLNDIVQVQLASETEGTGDLVVGTGIVIKRSVENGWVQIADFENDVNTAAAPGAWTDDVNYYVFKIGEFTDGDSTAMIVPMEKYITSTAATDTFLNLDRSQDEAYSGIRLTTAESKGTLSRKCKKIAAKALGRYTKQNSKKLFLVNPEDWDDEESNISAKAGRDVGNETVEGYQGFEINTSIGRCTLVSEPAKNKGSVKMLDLGSNGGTKRLRLYTTDGKLCHFVNPNGDITRLFENSNDLELRPFSMVAHAMGAPWLHGHFDL